MLILKNEWSRQPQQAVPVVDPWDFVWLGSTPTAYKNWSGVGSYSRALDASGGVGITSTGGNGNAITSATAPTTAQTQLSFVGVVKWTSGTATTPGIFATSASNSGMVLYVRTDSPGTLRFTKGGVIDVETTITLTSGVTYGIALTHNQSGGATYICAVPLGGGSILEWSGTNTSVSSAGDGTYTIANFRTGDAVRSFAGQIFLAAAMFRAISPAQARALAFNPWQIFSPHRSIIPVSAGFVTGKRIHYVVYPTSETRTPNQQDIINGWPGIATASGYERAPDDSTPEYVFETPVSGLSGGTNYKLALVWYDGNNPSDVVTYTFTTESTGINLTVGGNVQDSSSSTGTISQTHVITVAAATQDSTSSTGAITSGIDLTVAASTQDNSSANVVITQNHAITVATSTQDNSSANAVVTQNHAITVATCTQDNSSANAVITQNHAITVAASTQDNSSANVIITQVQILTVDGSTQVNTVPGVTIGSTGNYTGAACTQDSSSATGVITQVHVITVAASTQDNASSTGSIGSGVVLTGANSVQDSSSANAVVTQNHAITIATSTQDNSSANAVITQNHVIVVSNVSQANNSDSIVVTQGHNIVVAGVTQANLSDSVVIENVHILSAGLVEGTTTSSAVNIVQIHNLTAANVIQANLSSAISLVNTAAIIGGVYIITVRGGQVITEVSTPRYITDTRKEVLL